MNSKLALVCFWVLLLANFVKSTTRAEFRRFALVIGVNDGGNSRVKLRYAGTDALTFAKVLQELGGVTAPDLLILREPNRSDVINALEDLRQKISVEVKGGGKPELLVYFSGHSDENGLYFGQEKWTYTDFRREIDAIPARLKLAIVDACASGALTRIKGGSRLPAFGVDQSSNLSGYAFLTSSSGAESAQESDRIKASYFTHYLVTGLRGGADRNQDGRVTLGEAYEFAFHETLAQTEGTQSGAQHPAYDMRLTGTGDLVLTDLRGTTSSLVLDSTLQGRIFVRSANGTLVAELQMGGGKKISLGLEPGIYDINLDQGEKLYRGLVKVESLTHLPISLKNFELVAKEKTRSRGNPEKVPDAEWIPTRIALVPNFGYPGTDRVEYSHNFSLNLLTGKAHSISGLQLSLFHNTISHELKGLQLAAINSIDGNSRGLQLAGLFNAGAHAHRGLQISPLGNISDSLSGIQWSAINYAQQGRGIQLGILNTADSVAGIQFGIANFSNYARGLQFGLINYAKHSEGTVIGLVNIIRNGLHEIETTVDERSMLRTAFLLGGPYNYNYISFDMKARYPRHLWGGSAGIGVHLPKKMYYLDFDAGIGVLANEIDWDNVTYHGRLRTLLGFSPLRHFSVFIGTSLNAEVWESQLRPNLNPNRPGTDFRGSPISLIKWPGIMLGVRL